jgi:hypothetical protein
MRVPTFVAADYPGPRPDGPVLVRDGHVVRVDLDALPDLGSFRFSVAYGSNASPARLADKGLDQAGAFLLPAMMVGSVPAYEQRWTGYGAVPLTLVPEPGARTRTWVLGLPADATDLLDRTEGRVPGPAPRALGREGAAGRFAAPGTYQLGGIGPVAVADRWWLKDALAYLPGPATRVQLTPEGRWRTWPAFDQRAARRHADAHGPSRPAPAPGRIVAGSWPVTPLV